MNINYNSRKRKIYSDYSLLSDNQLIEMVAKRDNYNQDVIEVIEDILNEKGIPFHSSKKTENYSSEFGSAGNQGSDFRPYTQDEKIRSFIEKEKYWKCPSCGSSVEMDLAVCWKCQTEMPQNIVHAAAEEIAKEIAEDSKTGFAPWIMLFFLLLLLVAGTILRGMIHYRHPFANKGFLIFSGIVIVIVIISVTFKVMKWKK